MSEETVNYPPDPYVKQIYQAVSTSAGAVYLRNEDTVRLSTFSSSAGLTVSLRGVIVGLGGDPKTFTLDVVTDATRARKSVTARLGPGFVLYGAISVSGGSPNPGDVYATVEALVSDGIAGLPIALLASGSPTTGSAVPFSGQAQAAANVPRATTREITVANPGAGVDWTTTVPAGVLWQVQSIIATMTTSATVANRVLQYTADDSATVVARTATSTNQSASTTGVLSASVGLQNVANFPGSTLFASTGLWSDTLLPAFRIASNTINIQAADQWSAIRIMVSETINPL
jgi:hypothetical protein